ncbi:RNA recognition motif-containing protein 9 [Elsinoe australis]|uniref:RNA recognition motif-containing protein 9 n=1 Tax=Elsinoe australis TaxID=40998 RepID=A0A4U7AZ92_9PEZI|nr:RNA recognition motif-containing protein 9 [Elsinoe australis]
MSSSSSPPPPSSETKKRKRTTAPADEIEVDVNLPEPPSKKALRRSKKGKSSTTPKASLKDVTDLIDDNDDDATIQKVHPDRQSQLSGSGPSDPTATEATTKPNRSQYGIWIGNLSFTTTPSSLRRFLCATASLQPSAITRINLPLTARPLAPFQIRQIMTKQQSSGEEDEEEPPKFQNKGFAYVDFDTSEALFQALQVTETEFDGRKVLVKDAGNFEGRPKVEVPAAGAGAGADGDRKEVEEKPRSKKVFVGNLGFDVTREDLLGHMAQAGEVEDVFLATFEDSGKCKGFGWVRFAEQEGAENAVKGWVWKVEGGEVEDEEIEEALMEEEDGGESSEDEDEDDGGVEVEKKVNGAGKGQKAVKQLSAPKKRKWWINKLFGRMLRCEYAEDASTRYKKRFGKGRRPEGQNGDGAGAAANGYEPRSEARPRGTEEERAEARRKKHRDARTIAPGQALANAPRQSGAIVQSKGKKVTFD